MNFGEHKMLAGKLRPLVMRLIPVDKPDEYTEFIYESLQLNVKLQDNIISLANLKRY